GVVAAGTVAIAPTGAGAGAPDSPCRAPEREMTTKASKSRAQSAAPPMIRAARAPPADPAAGTATGADAAKGGGAVGKPTTGGRTGATAGGAGGGDGTRCARAAL